MKEKKLPAGVHHVRDILPRVLLEIARKNGLYDETPGLFDEPIPDEMLPTCDRDAKNKKEVSHGQRPNAQ